MPRKKKQLYAFNNQLLKFELPEFFRSGEKLSFKYAHLKDKVSDEPLFKAFVEFLKKSGHDVNPVSESKSEVLEVDKGISFSASIKKYPQKNGSPKKELQLVTFSIEQAGSRRKLQMKIEAVEPETLPISAKRIKRALEDTASLEVPRFLNPECFQSESKTSAALHELEKNIEAKRVLLFAQNKEENNNVAIHYAKEHRDKYMGVYRFDGGSKEKFQQSLKGFYDTFSGYCKIRYSEESLNNKEAYFLKEFVRAYPHWLFLVTNASCEIHEELEKLLTEWLPPIDLGAHIIVTTENPTLSLPGYLKQRIASLEEKQLEEPKQKNPSTLFYKKWHAKIGSEEFKKLKAAYEKNPSKTLQLSMLISVGQQHSEGEQFKAAIDELTQAMKDAKMEKWRCDIIVADTLQHYNYIAINKNSNAEEAKRKAAERGEHWIKENAYLIKNNDHFVIRRWEECKNDYASEFKSAYEKVKKLFIKDIDHEERYGYDAVAHQHVNDKALAYLLRQRKNKSGDKLPDIPQASYDYIYEELTLLKFLWENASEAGTKYQFILYPGDEKLFQHKFAGHENMPQWLPFSLSKKWESLHGIEKNQTVFFVEREDEERRLTAFFGNKFDSALKKTTKVFYYTGMQGIGKTQMALHYYHASKLNYTKRFWIDGRDLEGGFKRIGIQKGWVTPEATGDVVSIVKHKLEEEPGWLLVIDNALKLSELHDKLPKTGGHIVVTSNDTAVPESKATENAKVNLSKMTLEESRTLLRRTSGRAFNPATEGDLIEKMGYLPLAISQAGAYLRSNVDKGIEDYLSLEDELKDQNYPAIGGLHPAIWTGWLILRKTVCENNPKLSKWVEMLFDHCAHLHPNDIPVKVITDAIRRSYLMAKEEDVIKSIELLEQYSMLTYDRDAGTISFHDSAIRVAKQQAYVRRRTPETITELLRSFDYYLRGLKKKKLEFAEMQQLVSHIKHVRMHASMNQLKKSSQRADVILAEANGLLAEGLLEKPDAFKQITKSNNHQETMFFHQCARELLSAGVVSYERMQQYTWLEINRLTNMRFLIVFFKAHPTLISILSEPNEVFDKYISSHNIKLSLFSNEQKLQQYKVDNNIELYANSGPEVQQFVIDNAILDGNINVIERLLQTGVKLRQDVKDDDIPSLFLSANSTSPNAFYWLLDKVNCKESLHGDTIAEYIALRSPWSQLDKCLALRLLYTKDVFLKPAHYYASIGDIDRLKKMSLTQLTETTGSGATTIHFAAASGGIEVVKFLFSTKRAKQHTRDKLRNTEFSYAILSNQADVVSDLLKIDRTYIDEEYTRDDFILTPFSIAVNNGRLSIAKSLYQIEKSVFNCVYDSLHLGCHNFHVMLGWLLSVDAFLIEKIQYKQKGCDYLAQQCFGRINLLKACIENKLINPKIKNAGGYSILLYLACYGDFPAIKYLLANGYSNTYERTSDGLTLVDIIVYRGYFSVLKWLVDSGFVTRSQLEGYLVRLIISKKYDDAIYLVSEFGVDPTFLELVFLEGDSSYPSGLRTKLLALYKQKHLVNAFMRDLLFIYVEHLKFTRLHQLTLRLIAEYALPNSIHDELKSMDHKQLEDSLLFSTDELICMLDIYLEDRGYNDTYEVFLLARDLRKIIDGILDKRCETVMQKVRQFKSQNKYALLSTCLGNILTRIDKFYGNSGLEDEGDIFAPGVYEDELVLRGLVLRGLFKPQKQIINESIKKADYIESEPRSVGLFEPQPLRLPRMKPRAASTIKTSNSPG